MRRSGPSVSLFFLLVTALLATAGGLYGQIAGAGVVQGTITDPTGAVVPGAEVKAVGLATGLENTAQTTAAGFYVLTPLSAGEYKLTASAKGFQTTVLEKVIVNALSIVEVNFALTMGATTQEITVTAAPPILNTSDGSLGNTVTAETITELPLAQGVVAPGAIGPRDPEGFIYLLPGVSAGQGFAGNINGGMMMAMEVRLQGMPLYSSQLQGYSLPLRVGTSVDFVEEFKVITNGAPAQYDGQGTENYVLKSGTNRFHGSGFEYFRNTVLDARGFFGGTTTPKENQNEFGSTFGGPIRKNRLFFFAGYDGYRRRFGSPAQLNSLPTSAERTGDFSALAVPIYDPATTDCSTGVCTRQAFPGNIIPANRISTIAKYFESMLPNPINNLLQNNYSGVLQSGEDNDEYLIKMDGNITEKLRVTGFFNHGYDRTVGIYRSAGNSLPLPYTDSRAGGNVADLEEINTSYIISPSVLNQLGVSYNSFFQPASNYTSGGNYIQKSGLTGVPAGVTQFPQFVFSGPNSPTDWANRGETDPYAWNSPTLVVVDDLRWVHGRHNTVFGTQLMFPQRDWKSTLFGASFNFGNNETTGFDAAGNLLPDAGNGYASYLLGEVDNSSVTVDASGIQGLRYRNYAWYVQDDWKATSRLTFSLGLRYQIGIPWVEKYNRFSFLNPTLPNPAAGGAPGILEFGGFGPDSCMCRTPVRTHYKNFGPRVGLAYKLSDKTVLRAAYGVFNIPTGELGGAAEGAPTLGFAANPAFSSPDGGIHPAFTLGEGFPSFKPPPYYDQTINTGYTTTTPYGTGGVSYVDPQLGGKFAYYQNWNFTIQRQITPNLSLTTAYTGSNGHFLPTGIGRGIWSNQMQPKYLALGSLLYSPATPQNIAAAQEIFPEVRLPYPNFSGPIMQALLPFPQYSGIGDDDPKNGNSTYNALQVGAEKRFSSGLSFLISYTWEKTIDDAGSMLGGFLGAAGRTAYNDKLAKAVGVQDIPHTLVSSWVYKLPFGSGHSFGNSNPVAKALVSGWQLSAILTYRSGLPLGSFTGNGIAPDTGGAYADFTPGFSGPIRINGSWGSGDVLGPNPAAYLNKNGFQNPAPYTLGDTPRTMAYGVRNPAFFNEDLSLQRTFKIRENLRFQFEGNAFNAFNRVVFGGIGTSIASTAFGTVSSQANAAREVQIVGRVVF